MAGGCNRSPPCRRNEPHASTPRPRPLLQEGLARRATPKRSPTAAHERSCHSPPGFKGRPRATPQCRHGFMAAALESATPTRRSHEHMNPRNLHLSRRRALAASRADGRRHPCSTDSGRDTSFSLQDALTFRVPPSPMRSFRAHPTLTPRPCRNPQHQPGLATMPPIIFRLRHTWRRTRGGGIGEWGEEPAGTTDTPKQPQSPAPADLLNRHNRNLFSRSDWPKRPPRERRARNARGADRRATT